VLRVARDRSGMTVKRLRHLVATFAVVLFVPGGAATALSQSEAQARSSAGARAAQGSAAAAAREQRRVEDAWLAAQRHAARPRRS
jgi:hypothetical protein